MTDETLKSLNALSLKITVLKEAETHAYYLNPTQSYNMQESALLKAYCALSINDRDAAASHIKALLCGARSTAEKTFSQQ